MLLIAVVQDAVTFAFTATSAAVGPATAALTAFNLLGLPGSPAAACCGTAQCCAAPGRAQNTGPDRNDVTTLEWRFTLYKADCLD